MKDLVDYMEPHETGGILAHAFYRIVALYGQEIKQVCLLDHLFSVLGERQTDRQTETERDRDRERPRETETETETGRQTETERQR